jgi:hypothetical protein
MKQRIICKTLAVAVIVLFVGMGVQPAIAKVETEYDIDVEPKEYLFQTIINIANNPEVKELLEKYDNDLFKVDIDKSVYRKLFLRNPRLMFNTLFTKPSISIEYLNKCYNNGIEITNILGEDIALETIENVEVTNTKFFDELDDIVSRDEELSGRLAKLKEMNKELDANRGYPIICAILDLLLLPMDILFELIDTLSNFIVISLFLTSLTLIGMIPMGVILVIAYGFGCFY